MLKKFSFAFFICIFFFAAQAHDDKRVVTPQVSPSLRFTENTGQWENNILFRAQLDGGALYVEKNCLTFSFFDKKKYRAMHHGALANGKVKDLNIQFHAYKMHFENCNPDASVEKMQQGSDYENFFLGNDKSKWKGNVKNYHQIWLRELYNGIDYEAITSARGMKYNFHVKANADVNNIKLRYEGIDNIKLKEGKLILKPEVNEVIEHKPYAYQNIEGKIVEVPCEYKLNKNVLTFRFPKGYNKNYELVIDPLLVFAAQSGSTADNFGMTATFDMQGNLYAGGTVFGNGYPTTTGAFQSSFNGQPNSYANNDVVVTKYNSTGTSLLFSTYFGGEYSEVITSTIVDYNGNLCIYGATSSTNFPVTTGAYDTSFNGGQQVDFVSNGTYFPNGTDIYIAKFNSTGTSLLASTYIGGSGNDGINHVNHLSAPYWWNPNILEYSVGDSLQFNYGDQYRGEIQVDAANNIYIASSTRSSDFPMVGGFDNTLNGKQDGVLAKFNSNLSTLIYSSYVGGNSNDAGYGLIVKQDQEVYMTGGTCSGVGFPGSGGYQAAYQGGIADGYVIRVRSDGSAVTGRTFFGTSQYDQSYFIQDDKYDNIYIYGQSMGNTPVVTATNEVSVYSVPNTHQFVARFDKTLATLNMATKFGSSTAHMDISPCAFAVDKCNNIYLSGWGGDLLYGTYSTTGMPLLQANQSTTDGYDFYFMGLDSNAKALKYGSYFGGGLSKEHVDGGTSRFDAGGRIYQSACAGCWGNDDWPVTSGAWPGTPGNPNHSGLCNNGVVKLDFQLQTTIAFITTNTLSGCAPMTLTLTNTVPSTNPGSTYMWHLGSGNTTSTIPNPTVTYNTPGTYTVALVINDNLTCNKKDSAISIITILPKPNTNISTNSSTCTSAFVFNQTTTGTLSANPYSWNFGNGATSTNASPSYTYPSPGNYTVTLTVTDINGCTDTKTLAVAASVFAPNLSVSSNSLCAGFTTTLTASGGTSYTWTPAGSLNNPNIANPVASPNSTTVYTVQVLNTSSGVNCYGTLTTQILVQPKPTANFSFSGGHCSNQISISNLSSGNNNTYNWNFGNGASASDVSPSYTYPGNGTYTITLNVTDANGCKDIITQTVSIFNFTPGVVSNASLCNGASTVITAEGGTNYTWTPTTFLNDNSVAAPVANPPVTTIYTVTVLNNTPGYDCAKTLTAEVLVRPTPTAAFAFSINPCGGGIYFTDYSADDVTTWSWTLSPTATSSVQTPIIFIPRAELLA